METDDDLQDIQDARDRAKRALETAEQARRRRQALLQAGQEALSVLGALVVMLMESLDKEK